MAGRLNSEMVRTRLEPANGHSSHY